MRLFLLSLLFATVWAGVMVQEREPLSKSQVVSQAKAFASNPENLSAACSICSLIVDGVQALLKQGKAEAEINSFVKSACNALNIEQKHICDNIMLVFGSEIYYVLERAVFTPQEMCGAFVKDCGDVNMQTLWNMTIPGDKPPVKPWPRVESGGKTMRVLHLSDIHIDRQYAEGSEADCQKDGGPLYDFCCRDYKPTAGDREKKNIVAPAGHWGSPYPCDVPFRTFDSALKHIAETEKDLAYIIITGDFEAHDSWDYTRELTKSNIENVTATLLHYFPRTPIYVSIGNHEGVPMDAMMPHQFDEYSTRGPQWLYTILKNSWSNWLPNEALEEVQYRASYAIRPRPGLKLISINTIYCAEFNFYLYVDQVDPDGTLQWLIEQLLESESKGEKVHIISHIPSGASYCLKGWAHNFYDIVNRFFIVYRLKKVSSIFFKFENTIAAQFYGHTHNDHFQVYYEDADVNKRPTHFNFVVPSITTFHHNNPSYRVYTIDAEERGSYTVLDAETYYADLAEANKPGNQPEWKLEYKTKEAYGMSDLSPASWHKLIHQLETNMTMFKQFHDRYWRYTGHESLCVDERLCREKYTCGMKSARSHDEAHFCANN